MDINALVDLRISDVDYRALSVAHAAILSGSIKVSLTRECESDKRQVVKTMQRHCHV